MRQLGTIVAIAVILGTASALAMLEDGTGGATAHRSNSLAQQCRDEGIAPGKGNGFGRCVSEKASAFGKCVSDAAKSGAGNPTETCLHLKPGNGGKVDGRVHSPAWRCRNGVSPGKGNAFGKCVSQEASAFGKCISEAAGPGAGNPTESCNELKPGPVNGNGTNGEDSPDKLSVPPSQIEQVPPEDHAAPQSDAPQSNPRGNGTGGVAAAPLE